MLFKADLMKTNLWRANLSKAYLGWAKLNEADLGSAKLEYAYLIGTDLAGAKLFEADLTRSCYAPATAPASGSLAAIKGLPTVWFPNGTEAGLILLRDQLQNVGLRILEREATYAIELNKTLQLLGTEITDEDCVPRAERSRQSAHASGEVPRPPHRPAPGPTDDGASNMRELFNLGEGWFRRIAFEWTVAYGVRPGRPLVIVSFLIVACGIVYTLCLATRTCIICRVWSGGRIERDRRAPRLAGEAQIEPLRPRGFWAHVGHGLQFSLYSAFNIGWSWLEVGNWIARVRPGDYALRPVGWVRVIAGVQSLLCLYLLAMWALTYFGRPFQ
jgi:hypothetical protein